MKQLPRALLGLLALSLFACGATGGVVVDSEHDFKVALRAVTAAEAPLAGVLFEVDGARAGVTDEAGVLTTGLRGKAGQALTVRATCPAGFDGAEPLAPLRLAHARALGSEADEVLSVRAVCAKKLAELAVVVHAPQGAGFPVLVDGAPRSTTDEAGNAHVLLEVERSVPSVRVALDTTSNRLLIPQHPSRSFELHGEDAILIFDQTLSARPKSKPLPASRLPPRRIPQRLD